MANFIKSIELWILFSLTTLFYLAINGSDFYHPSGQLILASLLIILFVPKVKNEKANSVATTIGAALRVALFIEMQQHGWLEHSLMLGALIAAIAICSVFDGVEKTISIKSTWHLLVLIAILLLFYAGQRLSPGFNYGLGALLYLLPMKNQPAPLTEVAARLPSFFMGFVIGWFVTEQSGDGVLNPLALIISIILFMGIFKKRYIFNGPFLMIGAAMGYGYMQRQEIIFLMSAFVVWRLSLRAKTALIDR
jgi:hypothetical protein